MIKGKLANLVVFKVFASLKTLCKVLIILVKPRSAGPTETALVTCDAPTVTAETELTMRLSRRGSARTTRYARWGKMTSFQLNLIIFISATFDGRDVLLRPSRGQVVEWGENEVCCVWTLYVMTSSHHYHQVWEEMLQQPIRSPSPQTHSAPRQTPDEQGDTIILWMN